MNKDKKRELGVNMLDDNDMNKINGGNGQDDRDVSEIVRNIIDNNNNNNCQSQGGYQNPWDYRYGSGSRTPWI